MGNNTKSFVISFDLLDRFSAKYDALQKKITGINSNAYKIDLGINDNGLLKQSAGISKVVENVKSATQGATKAVDQHTTATQKAGNALTALKGKYEGVTSSVQKLAGSLAAMATGGALAGLSYIGAAQTQNRIQDTVKAISGNRKNQVSETKLNDYVKSVSGSGWTSSGKMSETVQAAYLFGGKDARGQKGLDLAGAAEKIAYAKQDSLGGASGADLMRSATVIKGKLRPAAEGDFRVATADVASMPGYDSMIKTARGRLKLLKKEAETINIKAEMDRHPWAVAQQNISDFKNAIGLGIAGPIGKISMLVAGLAKAMKDVPGLAGIVGWAAILLSVAGAASMAISVFSPLYSVLKGLNAISRVQAAVDWTCAIAKRALGMTTASLTVEEVMMTGASEAQAVAMVEESAASNMSTGTKLRLAAANIYASVATKAHTVATMVSSAISWGAAGAMGALAAIYGVLTGSISLSTIATWGLNTAMGILDALNPFTYLVAGAAILAGIIGYLVVKSGVLAPIWKDLQKIWKDITKGKFEKIMPDIGKMIGKIDIGGIFKTIVGKGPEEILGIISTGITGLLRWISAFIAPFISKIHEILKKLASIFDWIYTLWQKFWSWIQKAMPGAEKEKAKKLLESEVKLFNGGRDKTKDTMLSYDYDKKQFQATNPYGSSVPIDNSDLAGLAKYTGSIPRAQKLVADKNRYESLPGFAEGIAQAVMKGLGGLGTIIADAIMKLPGMTELAQAIRDLQTWLNDKLGLRSSSGGPGIADTSTTATYTTPNGGETYQHTPSTGKVKYTDWTMGSYGMTKDIDLKDIKDADAIKSLQDQASKLASHSSGVTITKTGVYTGLFHGPEETLSRASTIKGPGIISRALDLLDGAASGRLNASAAGIGAGGDIHIHNNNDFSGMKVANNIDIETLMRRIDKRIETVSLESTKRAIGQGRT